jgi:hypothetical protein
MRLNFEDLIINILSLMRGNFAKLRIKHSF